MCGQIHSDWHFSEKDYVDGGCRAFGECVETILSELIKEEGVAG